MRIYEMFMGPLEATKPWSTSSIAGVRRFLDRVFNATLRADDDAKPDDALTRLLHRTIRKVTDDIEAMRFNTAISAMMVLSNELIKLDNVPTEALEVLAKLLHPFAPHLGEEVWEMLGHRPAFRTNPGRPTTRRSAKRTKSKYRSRSTAKSEVESRSRRTPPRTKRSPPPTKLSAVTSKAKPSARPFGSQAKS